MAKLFIIAGHGSGDSGAVGNGYTEAERVSALASRIADRKSVEEGKSVTYVVVI